MDISTKVKPRCCLAAPAEPSFTLRQALKDLRKNKLTALFTDSQRDTKITNDGIVLEVIEACSLARIKPRRIASEHSARVCDSIIKFAVKIVGLFRI
jgi:hypothetical protein